MTSRALESLATEGPRLFDDTHELGRRQFRSSRLERSIPGSSDGEISSIYILRSAQRQGFGSALTGAMTQQLRRKDRIVPLAVIKRTSRLFTSFLLA